MTFRRFHALLIVCPALAAAQSYGHLQGRILDSTAAGIPRALITVINEDTGFRRSADSEITGGYTVSGLQPGVYKITVRKDGFRTLVRFGVRLSAAAVTRADFTLPVGPVEETITVEGTAPLIDQDSASATIRIERPAIERLPVAGRGILALLELAPGTNVVPATRGDAGQFTANGQRANANYFTVDGVSANLGVSAGGLPAQSTGGTLPALSAFGSMDSLMSLESVHEFRVTTSTAIADVGRLPGASVSLTSRSGSNEFHGATIFRMRHDALAANDWFSNQAGYSRLRQRLYDFTQTFGGPLVRNRTFFYTSYQHMSLRQPYVWRQPTPTSEARLAAADWAKPLMQLYPMPTGPALAAGLGDWVGRSNRPASLDTGSIRLDQAVGSHVTLFARYNVAPSRNQFGALTVNQLDLRSQSLTLGGNARLGAGVGLDFRINRSEAAAESAWKAEPPCVLAPLLVEFLKGPGPCDYLVRFSIGGLGQLVSGREGERRQKQFQVVQSASLYRSRHSLSIGVDYRAIRAQRLDPTGALGIIADNVAALGDTHTLWVARSPAQSSGVDLQEVSAWLMDTWRVAPRITLSAGLRWEFSPSPIPEKEIYFLEPGNDRVTSARRELWPLRYRNFAPRVGLALRVTQDGRTVLRAGGGLFYNSSLSIATDILNGGPLNATSFFSEVSAPFSSELSFGFLPGLRLPSVKQWNISLDRALGRHDVVSLGYLGAAGRNLLRREVGGAGNTPTSMVALTTNHGRSDYHALALQYRRRLARGLQVQAAYTWSHSIDNGSSDAFLMWAGPGPGDRGSSDFDLRHVFTIAASLEASFLRGWAFDSLVHARSGFPITPLQREEYMGINLSNAFRPDLVPEESIWIKDAIAPGGRRLNPRAFRTTTALVQGALGRNVLEGFGMWQIDLAVRRELRLGERRRLQFRVEAYNALNHPNFADPVKFLNNALFGHSSSMLNTMLGTGSPGSGLSPFLQAGAPRSVQGSVRFQF